MDVAYYYTMLSCRLKERSTTIPRTVKHFYMHWSVAAAVMGELDQISVSFLGGETSVLL